MRSRPSSCGGGGIAAAAILGWVGAERVMLPGALGARSAPGGVRGAAPVMGMMGMRRGGRRVFTSRTLPRCYPVLTHVGVVARYRTF